MDPLCFKVPRNVQETIRVEHWSLPFFYDYYHYHNECQLTFVRKGSGKLYSSGFNSDFKKGELYLIGKNVPHVFKSDKSSKSSDNPADRAEAVTIFFDGDQFISFFDEFPEAHSLVKLIDNSRSGIKVLQGVNDEIRDHVNEMLDAEGFERIILLARILSFLTKSNEVRVLSAVKYSLNDPYDSKKLNKVFDFINQNYKRQISLEEVAAQINMTPSAFCRFFKRRTKNTFSNYLIETRIATACKLLLQKDVTVSESCYESGYNSTSNFHRHFRRVTGYSPIEYKKKICETR
jgi:AraC-like DNA-binding protein